MMFKKKSNLPPRPQCPTRYDMIEDLSVVPNEDPLFVVAGKISNKTLNLENGHDVSKEDAMYLRVKQFFMAHEELQKGLKNLKVKSENLKEKEADILKLSIQLKDQTNKASAD